MSNGYTDEEINTSVSSLIRTQLRRPSTALGTPDIQTTFSDVQEAASGIFLLNPVAPFYVIELAARRLAESLQLEAKTIDSLVFDLQVTGKKVFPVDNLNQLSNAKVALFELENAVTNRSVTFNNVTTSPAFQRFQANVNAFLSDYGSNVKSNGVIVPTPQQAKSAIPGLLSTLKKQHAATKDNVSLLIQALADFNDLNLPAMAAGGVISRSRETIARLVATLQAKDPTARLEDLRQSVLDLLSTKAAISQVGNFKVPGAFFDIAGPASPFSDSAHPANAAVLDADNYAPYNISTATDLSISLEGAAPFTVTLSKALFARADGILFESYQSTPTVVSTLAGPFNIPVFPAPPTLLTFYVYDIPSDQFIQVDAVLLTGPAVPATQVVIDINNAFTAAGVNYSAAGVGPITISGGAPGSKIAVGGANGNSIVGFTITGGYRFTSVTNAGVTGANPQNFNIFLGTNDLFDLTLQDTVAKTLRVVQVVLGAGLGRTAASIAGDIVAALQVANLQAQYTSVSLGGHVRIIALDPGSIPKITIGQGTANGTLGFTTGATYQGTDDNKNLSITINGGPPFTHTFTAGLFSAKNIADELTLALAPNFTATHTGGATRESVSISYVGVAPPTFTATMVFPSGPGNTAAFSVLGLLTDVSFSARSNTARQVAKDINAKSQLIEASTKVVPVPGGENVLIRSEPTDPSRLVVYKQRGSGPVTLPGPPLTIQVTLQDATTVLIGDILAIRDGVNISTKWTITAISSNLVTAVGTFPTAVAGQCTYEIGHDFTVGLTPITVGGVIKVLTGTGKNTYVITKIGPVPAQVLPFEFEVDLIVAGFADPKLLPSFMTGTIGFEKLTVASLDTTTASKVEISGPAAGIFFTAPPGVAFGTTPWVKLPSKVSGLDVDDLLELYSVNYAVPTAVFMINSVEATVIGLTTPISSVQAISFNQTVPPFARLRSLAYQKYATLNTNLTSWLDLVQNQDTYFKEMSRLINIVIQESNPTVSQIQSALSALILFRDVLLIANSSNPTNTLESFLNTYAVARVDIVDELIRTYREKGSGRAIDILLTGQFSAFFGLDVHDVSYSGAMLSQMREIAQKDIPISKIGRKLSTTSKVISSIESPDYEYDTSDTANQKTKTVPSEFEQVPHVPGDFSTLPGISSSHAYLRQGGHMGISEELRNQLKQRLDIQGFAHVADVVMVPNFSNGAALVQIVVEVHGNKKEAEDITYARVLTNESNTRLGFMLVFRSITTVADRLIRNVGLVSDNIKALRKDMLSMSRKPVQALVLSAHAAERLQVMINFLDDTEELGAPRLDYRAAVQEARMITENEP